MKILKKRKVKKEMQYLKKEGEGNLFTCSNCHKILLATVGNHRVAVNDCIEIILGTHPAVHPTFCQLKEWKDKSLPIHDIHVICEGCQPNALLQIIVDISKEAHIQNGFDWPVLESGKGCWITITEQLPNRKGFYANIQVCPESFSKILANISLLWL